jgi:hypothetical protein
MRPIVSKSIQATILLGVGFFCGEWSASDPSIDQINALLQVGSEFQRSQIEISEPLTPPSNWRSVIAAAIGQDRAGLYFCYGVHKKLYKATGKEVWVYGFRRNNWESFISESPGETIGFEVEVSTSGNATTER